MTCLKGAEKRKIRTTLQVRKNNKSQKSILVVFRSNKNISAQIIDLNGNVLASATSSSKIMKDSLKGKSGIEIASAVGEEIAKEAKKLTIKKVVFDRGGYLYHGRVAALADAARANGLEF